MNKRNDILLDEANELKIQNGDFVIGVADLQHVNHIIEAHPGEYKEFPQVGFGVRSYLKSNTTKTAFKRNLRVQLNFDGYVNPLIDLSKGFKNLKIEV
ncbi:hypothetical protein [Psychroflexus sp. ALD_RP9]|uniref:hypothetical protein n=1 Tax=Psychroflexus sp. ALD_RP9 TaxID=2777186 RepID=UPI001A8DAF3B|nr:hypothetical protein [Psychroflexus sp. ALD_RP9]QSS96582.1 hypothetical protein IMZ30_09025 [Psychroflexus sp. ALD_RP9]